MTKSASEAQKDAYLSVYRETCARLRHVADFYDALEMPAARGATLLMLAFSRER